MGNMFTDSSRLTLLSGEELFRGDGPSVPLRAYWQWSGSSLVDNTARGVLAEFLVAAALDLHRAPRMEWESHDLKTQAGVRIEVKSAATVQSWRQKKASPIRFGIAPRKDYNRQQHSDIYVFCVWRPANPGKRPLAGDDTLNVDEWTFYVLQTAVLDDKCPEQKVIGETALLELKPQQCCYRELRDTIEGVAGR